MNKQKIPPEVEYCPCGLFKGHESKCLSISMVKKERIGKYSGQSKTPYGAYNER